MGAVRDVLHDDHLWIVRYMVVDTRNWLPGKRVLVSPHWVVDAEWKKAKVRMDLDRARIKDAPIFDREMPISQDYEVRLYHHFKQPAYWADQPA